MDSELITEGLGERGEDGTQRDHVFVPAGIIRRLNKGAQTKQEKGKQKLPGPACFC